MAAKAKEQERQRLLNQIEEWNSNRLDLFALSQPNEVTRSASVSLAGRGPTRCTDPPSSSLWGLGATASLRSGGRSMRCDKL